MKCLRLCAPDYRSVFLWQNEKKRSFIFISKKKTQLTMMADTARRAVRGACVSPCSCHAPRQSRSLTKESWINRRLLSSRPHWCRHPGKKHTHTAATHAAPRKGGELCLIQNQCAVNAVRHQVNLCLCNAFHQHLDSHIRNLGPQKKPRGKGGDKVPASRLDGR